MTDFITLTKTTFYIPKQGKDVYSPMRKITSEHKLTGTVNSEQLELSTYNKKVAANILDLLKGLKAKFEIGKTYEYLKKIKTP